MAFVHPRSRAAYCNDWYDPGHPVYEGNRMASRRHAASERQEEDGRADPRAGAPRWSCRGVLGHLVPRPPPAVVARDTEGVRALPEEVRRHVHLARVAVRLPDGDGDRAAGGRAQGRRRRRERRELSVADGQSRSRKQLRGSRQISRWRSFKEKGR